MLLHGLLYAQASNIKWLDEALYFNGGNGSWYQNPDLSNASDVLWAVRNYTAYNDVLWACRDIKDAATAAACLAFTNTTNITVVTGTGYPGTTTTSTSTGTTGISEVGQGELGQTTGTTGTIIQRPLSPVTYPKCPPGAVTFTIGGLLKTEGSLTILLYAAIKVTWYSEFYQIYDEAVRGNGVYGRAVISDATLTSSIQNLTNGESLDGIANVTIADNPCYVPAYTILEEEQRKNRDFARVTSAFESLSGTSFMNWRSNANYSLNGTWTGSGFINNLTNGSLPAIGVVGSNAQCGPLVGNPICGDGLCCSRQSYVCVGRVNVTECLY